MRYTPTPAEENALIAICHRALNGGLSHSDEKFRVYSAYACGPGHTGYTDFGIAIDIAFGPGIAFLPYFYLHEGMTEAELRLLVRRQIPYYTHIGTWKANEQDKRDAIAFLDSLEQKA